MARPLTPEERYNRIINQAWWAQNRDLKQLKSIRTLLLEAYGELSGALASYGSETLTIQQVSAYRQQIQRTMETFGREYETALKAEMQAAAANAGAAVQEALLTHVGGTPIRLSMDVRNVSQQMYDAATKRTIGGLTLSERIWQMQTGAANLLERDVLTQMTMGSSAQDMARRLQRYLLPGKELPKGNVPSATYSNQPRDVSYNAYRLARTEINQTWHSVHNKADAELAKEGVVLGTRWVLSAQHATRMLAATDGKTARDICDDWAERMPGSPILKGQPDASPEREAAMLAKLQEYGIDPRGVYLPGRAPLDHPNGLCRTESVLTPREVLLEKYGFGDKGGGQAPASTPTEVMAGGQVVPPFATRQEAEAYIKKFSRGAVSLRGMDTEMATQVAQGLEDSIGKSKVRPFDRITVKPFKTEAIARVNMSNELEINSAIAGSAQRWRAYTLKAAEADEYVRGRVLAGNITDPKLRAAAERATRFPRSLVDGSSLRSSIVHEVGHHIDNTVLMRNTALRQAIIDRRDEYVLRLSSYADKNAFEFVAESYAAWRKGEYDAVMPELLRVFSELEK